MWYKDYVGLRRAPPDDGMTDVIKLLADLNEAMPAGTTAYHAYTPSVFMIPVPAGEIMIAVGHNVAGWEAALDTGGDQTPLADGPADPYAPDAEVVAWIATLVKEAVV